MSKCEKCGLELEANAEVCTSCGTSVTDDLQTSKESNSKKIKRWTLKIVAFFISAIVFVIAKIILTAINGGAIDGKLEAGGLLLFYGSYSLLSGLFLKDSSAKKRGGWILVIYLVGSISFTYFMNHSNYGLETQIIDMNKNTPYKLDSETELLSAKLNGEDVDIEYRLINYTSNDFSDKGKITFENQLRDNFCAVGGYKKIMNYGKDINFYIYGKYNSKIVNFRLNKDACK